MLEIGGPPPRYQFFLDPDDCPPFPVCPLCNGLAPVTPFGLVLSFPAGEPLILRLDCRFCAACDLVTIGQDDLEERMAEVLMTRQPALIGQDYRFLGTLDMADLEMSLRRPYSAKWLAKRLHNFVAEWEHHFDDEDAQADQEDDRDAREDPVEEPGQRPIPLHPPRTRPPR